MRFGSSHWWFRKEACDEFRRIAQVESSGIILPLGHGANGPTRVIDVHI